MNKTLEEGIELAESIVEYLKSNPGGDTDVILCAPFIHLSSLSEIVRQGKVETGAQNCSSEESGAFTGEISASMIRSTGATWVIIGHSERRSYFKEDNPVLNKKVNTALNNGLKVIFCCGEILSEREGNNHFNVVRQQLEEGLFSLKEDQLKNIVIAYEPVWAIGTGVTATPAQAQEMHAYIRKLVAKRYGMNIGENTTILYGGSCNPGNAGELFANNDVDGGLIGGASLKRDDFCAIIESV